MSKETLLNETSPLVSEELKAQMKPLFDKMTSKVVLKAVLDFDDEKSLEMGSFLKAVASCSQWIDVSFYEKGEDAAIDLELHTEYLPAVGLYGEKYSGACFHGTPGGKEISSFVAAICGLGGAGNPLEKRLLKNIGLIKKPVNAKVFVSLACHHCPHVVAACQKIALANELVEAEMYDANLYPDLVEKYKIERIPMVVMNDSACFMGQKSIEEIVNRFMSV